jgi:hypothetical protein
MTDSGEPAGDGEARRARRQERLQQLRMVGPGRGAAARAVAGGGGMAGAGAGVGAGAVSDQRRKALGRMARILTDTPADGTGAVPGTPFTQAGVAVLLDTLGKRARNEGAPGARMAARILTFLQAGQGEAEGDVHGVSVQKLQRLAKLTGSGKGRRGVHS